MYAISTDPKRRLVTIKIIGLVTAHEVADLYRDEYAAIAQMGCQLGEHYALVDLTECTLQLQDVVAAFQKQMHSPGKAKRLALFTGNSVARMQVRRITQRDHAQLFASRGEAEAWLFDDTAIADAA